MKVKVKGNHNEYLKKYLPTLEEKIDALLEGGQKLANLKQKIASVKERTNRNN